MNIQFSEHSGTPDDFIARLRRELDENPKDDLRLFSLAMWLFMASRYQESTQVAASVCRPGYEIDAGEELGNRARAHQEIRAALERVELIIESEYAASGATVDDTKIALAQFQWMKKTFADAE